MYKILTITLKKIELLGELLVAFAIESFKMMLNKFKNKDDFLLFLIAVALLLGGFWYCITTANKALEGLKRWELKAVENSITRSFVEDDYLKWSPQIEYNLNNCENSLKDYAPAIQLCKDFKKILENQEKKGIKKAIY